MSSPPLTPRRQRHGVKGGEEKRKREMREKRKNTKKEIREKRGVQLALPSPSSPRLTERDYTALAWLVEQKAATTSQVTILLGYLGDGPITDRRGSMIMARWEDLGLVERTHVWHRKPAVVTPTFEAARLMGLARWRKPALGTLNHTLHASQIRLQVCRPGSSRRWRTEEQMRAMLPAGARVPDGALVEADGALTAVEVELTSHGRTRVREAMTSLLAVRAGDGDLFHHVLYLCAPAVVTQVTAVRDELPAVAQARVVVLPCPSL